VDVSSAPEVGRKFFGAAGELGALVERSAATANYVISNRGTKVTEKSADCVDHWRCRLWLIRTAAFYAANKLSTYPEQLSGKRFGFYQNRTPSLRRQNRFTPQSGQWASCLQFIGKLLAVNIKRTSKNFVLFCLCKTSADGMYIY